MENHCKGPKGLSMSINYNANHPKKRGGDTPRDIHRFPPGNLHIKIICTVDKYPIRENITIRKQFDFFLIFRLFWFFFGLKTFLLEKTGWLIFIFLFLAPTKAYPTGREKEIYKKMQQNILGFHANWGSG